MYPSVGSTVCFFFTVKTDNAHFFSKFLVQLTEPKRSEKKVFWKEGILGEFSLQLLVEKQLKLNI